MSICDYCAFNALDDETEEYFCSAELDEDELERFFSGSDAQCSFFKPYDEYKLVEKQN